MSIIQTGTYHAIILAELRSLVDSNLCRLYFGASALKSDVLLEVDRVYLLYIDVELLYGKFFEVSSCINHKFNKW